MRRTANGISIGLVESWNDKMMDWKRLRGFEIPLHQVNREEIEKAIQTANELAERACQERIEPQVELVFRQATLGLQIILNLIDRFELERVKQAMLLIATDEMRLRVTKGIGNSNSSPASITEFSTTWIATEVARVLTPLNRKVPKQNKFGTTGHWKSQARSYFPNPPEFPPPPPPVEPYYYFSGNDGDEEYRWDSRGDTNQYFPGPINSWEMPSRATDDYQFVQQFSNNNTVGQGHLNEFEEIEMDGYHLNPSDWEKYYSSNGNVNSFERTNGRQATRPLEVSNKGQFYRRTRGGNNHKKNPDNVFRTGVAWERQLRRTRIVEDALKQKRKNFLFDENAVNSSTMNASFHQNVSFRPSSPCQSARSVPLGGNGKQKESTAAVRRRIAKEYGNYCSKRNAFH